MSVLGGFGAHFSHFFAFVSHLGASWTFLGASWAQVMLFYQFLSMRERFLVVWGGSREGFGSFFLEPLLEPFVMLFRRADIYTKNVVFSKSCVLLKR